MRGIWRVLGLALVGPLSLGTVVPSIQWCALDWSQVSVACFAVCSDSPHRTCSEAKPQCAGTGGSCTARVSTPPPCMPPPIDEAVATGGEVAGAMPCAASGGCPAEAAVEPLLGLDDVASFDEVSTPSTPSSEPWSHRRPAGRAFCLGDPAGATSPRPAASIALDPLALAAILPAIADLDRPTAARSHRAPREIARPPTRAWTPLPPARAPPGERST